MPGAERPRPAPSPSPWLERHGQALRRAARDGPVLDVACGRGRHARRVLGWGARVVAVDRDAAALAALRAGAGADGRRLLAVRADVEAAAGWPVGAGTCGAILVFRFLFRPLAPLLTRTLRPGGLLLYETFTRAQRDLPHGPSREAFLLEPGELPGLFPELEVVAYEEGWSEGPRPCALARLAARRPAGAP